MKKTYLFLTGGLGNQLFQVAAALAVGKGTKIVIDAKSGNPRNAVHPVADFFSLGTNLDLTPMDRGKFALSTKVGGYVLRSNAEPVRMENSKIYRRLVRILASCFFSLFYMNPVIVKPNIGVGFSGTRLSSKLNTLLIGYFQTYRWVSEPTVKELMESLQVKNGSAKYRELRERIMEEKPIIIHIRRGDYAFEPNFGVLPSSYYREGLDFFRSKGVMGNVWAFTDDNSWALSMLGSKRLENFQVEIMNDSELSTGEVFDLMRSGSGYIIANSSFSWWGAYLRRNDEAMVVAPEPWFIGLPEPLDLIPPDWNRIPSFKEPNQLIRARKK